MISEKACSSPNRVCDCLSNDPAIETIGATGNGMNQNTGVKEVQDYSDF